MVNPISKRARRNPRIEWLGPRILLARDTVYISEFLANNDSVLADQDGQFSDWIELHNPTAEPVDLSGWSLTDSADELGKWKLPSITIPPDGFRVIFASGKDRRDPTGELHANFKLSTDGEYLALVQPNQTAVHQFAPSYPVQTSDVSFGFPNDGVVLVDDDAVRSFRIPMADDTSDIWRSTSFDDSDWRQAFGAVGYEHRLDNAGFEEFGLSPWSSRGSVQVTDHFLGVTPSEGDQMVVATTRESAASRSAAEFYLGLPRGSLDDVNQGEVQRVSALKREITVGPGSVLTLDWDFLTNDVRDGDFAFVFVSDSDDVVQLADPTVDLVASSSPNYERETGRKQLTHVFQAAGTYTIGIGVAQAIDQEFDSALVVDNLRIDGIGDVGQSYHSTIQTQIPELVSSIHWRHEFEYDGKPSLRDLRLRVQYDDGFAAFLNGQLVASANAPEELTWNAVARDTRPNDRVLEYEEFAVPVAVLQAGINVLAIAGLNAEADVLDFLLDAELLGVGTVNDEPAYLEDPTPGRHNLSTVSTTQTAFAEEVIFDRAAGLYDSPFLLRMSTESGAMVHFTTNGSKPTERNGTTYEHPIPIDSTMIVRAVAIKGGTVSREIRTATFLFLDQVVRQSTDSAIEAGFPSTWDDYEMDPDVIGAEGQDLFGGKYAATIRDDLMSLPSVSLVMDQDDWFGSGGLFVNKRETGRDWEREASVELLFPDGSHRFHIDAGLRIHGNRSRDTDKLSMRLLFRADYGHSKLQYPLFGDDGPDDFDSLVLRSSGSEFLVGFHYIRDETVRQLEQGTGNPSVRGRFVHVYVNGLYWGVYNLMERVDAQFAVNRDGGEKQEYDVITAGTPFVPVASNGTTDTWKQLVSLAQNIGESSDENRKTATFMELQGRNADGTANPTLEPYLDVSSFINNIVINAYVGNTDWPAHNFYMYRRRGPQSEGFKFLVWDAEFSLRSTEPRVISDLDAGPAIILPPLLTSEAFRIQFTDQVHRLVSPGGVLYVNPEAPEWDAEHPENNEPARLYADVASSVSSAIVAESARWGDAKFQTFEPPFTRDEDWLTVVQERLTQFFPGRTEALLSSLRADDLYRDPPLFGVAPGPVESEATLRLSSQNSAPIYYTADGTDPMLVDGSVSPNALRYGKPIALTETTFIRARSLDGTKWSAIDGGLYTVDEEPASAKNLRITEVHYHPEPDGDTEFLELTNVSPNTIHLEGVRIEGGVTFDFGDSQFLRLAPGERLVLVRDREAFLQVYPDRDNIAAGQYEGNLSNGGEELRLLAADGTTIQRFQYQDDGDWPSLPDGGGPSLQLIASDRDASLGSSWRPSAVDGGTPGQPEYRAGDSNLDGVFDSSDLVQVFQRGEYEDALNGNSTFADGDWDGDGDFTTSDLVLAFQTGEYTSEVLPGQHGNAESANIASATDAVFSLTRQ